MTTGQTLQTILEVLAILGVGLGFVFEQRLVLLERRLLRRWKTLRRRFRRSKNHIVSLPRPPISNRAA